MNLWTQADTNGLLLLKKSWASIKNRPTECIHAVLLIANTLTCFVVLFLFEYQLYGIHMLDIKTLQNLFSLNFFEHLSHVLTLFGITLFSIFSSLFIHASFSYTVINDLLHKEAPIAQDFRFTLKHIQKLFFLSLVYLNHYIITVVDIISISPFLTFVQHNAEGRKHDGPTVSKSTAGALVVPVLLLSKSNSLGEALEESKQLVEKTFGPTDGSKTSFAKVKIILYTLAGTAILISAPFDAIDTLATSFFAGFLLLLFFKIIEVGLIIYQGSLYAYCTHNISKAFSKEELAQLL